MLVVSMYQQNADAAKSMSGEPMDLAAAPSEVAARTVDRRGGQHGEDADDLQRRASVMPKACRSYPPRDRGDRYAAGGESQDDAEQRINARRDRRNRGPRVGSAMHDRVFVAIVAATTATEEATSIAACTISIEPSNGIPGVVRAPPAHQRSWRTAARRCRASGATLPVEAWRAPRIARAHETTTMSARIENEKGGRPASAVIRRHTP